jgi:hypothetical protein
LKDEYYRVNCVFCEASFTWDINYDGDDNVIYLKGNNIIAIGDYFKHYNKNKYIKTNLEIKEDDIIPLLQDAKIFTIPCPEKQLNKQNFQNYINLQLKNLI